MSINPQIPDPSRKKPLENLVRYSAMGFQMGATIFLGTWAGIKLDQHFKTPFPIFTLLLACISVFAAIYFVIKDLIHKKK